MSDKDLLECIEFFKELKVVETDVTTDEESNNHNMVVVVNYVYKRQSFTTNKLYYKNILYQDSVRYAKAIVKHFDGDVYWLDIGRHDWPKGKHEAELEKTIIDEIALDDGEFKSLLKKIANNNKTGFLQRITAQGKSAQYHHNLENNNHWHDIILLIQEMIKKNGVPVEKNFFSRLVFRWDGNSSTKRERSSLDGNVEWKNRSFIENLYDNIKSLQQTIGEMEILNVLKQKGQIILQGPPGTGKTYTAKDLAEQIICLEITADKKEQKKRLEGSERFKLIQFHPAYSYEDFVRGIVAKSKGDFIEYLTENKVLVSFANKAKENYLNSLKPQVEYSKEKRLDETFALFIDSIQEQIDTKEIYPLTNNVSIVDIDEASFRYKGKEGWSKGGNRMRFKDIKQAYLDDDQERQDVRHNRNLSGLARHHASYYIRVLDDFKKFLELNKQEFQIQKEEPVEALKDYVLIIDEINRANLPAVLGELIYALEYRGEEVESMYPIEEERSIMIPPNLLIIGTMNTSDRSVGHIDYAIRRRFAFIDVLPQILQDENFELALFKQVSELFIENFEDYAKNNTVKLKLSSHLSEEFRPEHVWLGHSYFIKNEGDFSLRKKYEIIPILKEYIKDGILKQSAESIIDNL